MAQSDARDADFRAVDWDEVGGDAPRVEPGVAAFAATVGLLAAAYAYHLLAVPAGEPLVADYRPTRLDWLLALSLVVVSYVVAPLAGDAARTRRYWRRLRRDPWATASVAYLGGAVVVAVLAPLALGGPEHNLPHAFQPPAFTTVGASAVQECVGPVADGRCHGTLRYPLGTNGFGESMTWTVVEGLRVTGVVAVVTAALVIPIATAVGTVAGYAGGLVDEVLMRYVDVQATVPAFVVYLVLVYVYGRDLFMVVAVFGLLSWGGVARIVRSEVLQRREEGYVRAAREAGASRLHVVRRHLLPNVSGTVVTATTRQIPALVLAEAALAFMKLTQVRPRSFGRLIEIGLTDWHWSVWWTSTIPVVFLALTVVAISVLGDAMRDVLDPRE